MAWPPSPILTTEALTGGAALTTGVLNRAIEEIRAKVDGLQTYLPTILLIPGAAAFPNANFPQIVHNAGINWADDSLDFDPTTDEACFFYAAIPTGITINSATFDIFSRQASATTGNVGWKVTHRVVGDADAWDSAGTLDTVAVATVKGTAGQVLKQSISLTTAGWAAGKILQVKLARDAATDTCAEDTKFLLAMIKVS